MAFLSTTDAAGTNTRHKRFGASTLLRERIYPNDIQHQIVRGAEPKQDPDRKGASKELWDLVAFAGGKTPSFSPALVQPRPTLGVLFNPGSVLDKDKVASVRRKKQELLEEKRALEVHFINYRWGRKYGFREEEVIELEQKFHEYDKDDSGTIDLRECEQIIDDLQILSDELTKGHKSSKRGALKRVIDELDRSRSGTLNFIQFMDLIKRVREGRLEELLGELAQARTPTTPRVCSRPSSAQSSPSFNTPRAVNTLKIAQVRAKREERIRQVEQARLEDFVERSARRMRLSREETMKALGFTRDLLKKNEEKTPTSHINYMQMVSPKVPKKVRFVRLTPKPSPRARRGVVTGGFVVPATTVGRGIKGGGGGTFSKAERKFESGYKYYE